MYASRELVSVLNPHQCCCSYTTEHLYNLFSSSSGFLSSCLTASPADCTQHLTAVHLKPQSNFVLVSQHKADVQNKKTSNDSGADQEAGQQLTIVFGRKVSGVLNYINRNVTMTVIRNFKNAVYKCQNYTYVSLSPCEDVRHGIV